MLAMSFAPQTVGSHVLAMPRERALACGGPAPALPEAPALSPPAAGREGASRRPQAAAGTALAGARDAQARAGGS